FSSFSLSNWARVRSFSSSLPQQTNTVFSGMTTRMGAFDGGGVKGAAKLSFASAGGKSTNIWLTFTRGPNSLYVPVEFIEGDFSCGGDSCTLKGRVMDQIPLLSSKPYFREGDLVDLTKSERKLVGTLRSESKEVFRGDIGAPKAEEVKYQLEFGLN